MCSASLNRTRLTDRATRPPTNHQAPPGILQQSALFQELVDSAAVTLVESDMVVTAVQTSPQTGATWGLDRIDQPALPLNGAYAYNTTASDVSAYIIDTGVCVCVLCVAALNHSTVWPIGC